MTDITDLLPPITLYQQLRELADHADAGDPGAQQFMRWFAGDEDTVEVAVRPDNYEFDDVARVVAIFAAARAASREFETGERPTLQLTLTVAT